MTRQQRSSLADAGLRNLQLSNSIVRVQKRQSNPEIHCLSPETPPLSHPSLLNKIGKQGDTRGGIHIGTARLSSDKFNAGLGMS